VVIDGRALNSEDLEADHFDTGIAHIQHFELIMADYYTFFQLGNGLMLMDDETR
jgi:hypothetical protein